jgi:hypothetical protein
MAVYYTCATSFHLTSGTLTLSGNASDTWILKSASDLVISGTAARVVSPSCNVWWRVVSSASFGAGSSLTGNILADTAITLAAGASLSGKALARTAEVTLSSNAITACTVPVPAFSEWAIIILTAFLDEETRLREELLEDVRSFEAGKLPAGLSYKTADAELNAVYSQIMKKKELHLGTVTKEGIRDTQIKWLAYRDAWAKFGTIRYPGVTADAWKAWATLRRVVQLKELLDPQDD